MPKTWTMTSIKPTLLQCSKILTPEHSRVKRYPHIKPHLVTTLLAFRSGSFTVKVCRECAYTSYEFRVRSGWWK